jgi:cyclophilin family peptidyl-prolyl cis-trans isomerase
MKKVLASLKNYYAEIMTKQTLLQIFSAIAIIAVIGFIFIQNTNKKDTMQNNDTQNDMQEQTIATSSDAQTTSSSNTKQAVFTTNYGTFTIALEDQKAPNTVQNFVELAQSGFYNGQRFHRVIEGFMIQGGDPNSKDVSKKALWGTGGPGYQFADEFHPDLKNNIGTISMANSGPNTNGSQFFINVKDNNFLDGRHAVFGTVTQGLDVVMTISTVSTDPSDKPLQDVMIEKVEIK